MNQSKIQLSEEEMQLVLNREWILTKERIIEKVYRLFGTLSGEMQSSILQMPALLPSEILQSTPKISKGEKYEGLPYVVLDYPRCFSIDHVFAIRTFFWWGNYFSSSLHLKGKYQQQFAGKINEAIKKNEFEGCYLSVAGDEFNFNLRNKNYLLIDNTTTFAPYKVMENDFFKISIKIPLQQWNAVPERLTANFLHLISVMTA